MAQNMNMGKPMGNLQQPMNPMSQPMGNIPQSMGNMGQPMHGQPMGGLSAQNMPMMSAGQPMGNMGSAGAYTSAMGPPGANVTPSNVSASAPSSGLVDDFEEAFLACMAPLMDDDMTNQDSEEIRAGIQQSLQKFLETGKSLEAFFLQKRLSLSVQRPELLVKEDITDLRAELMRKDALIHKHYEKLQSWQDMLNNLQQGQLQAQQPPVSMVQNPGTPQANPINTIRPQPPMPVQVPTSMQSPHHMHQMPQFPMRGQFHADMMQGPLAKLERSTANIGMPDGWQ